MDVEQLDLGWAEVCRVVWGPCVVLGVRWEAGEVFEGRVVEVVPHGHLVWHGERVSGRAR